jgi:predicted acylesterase/phospholipase RssA/CRP-like cAMP-binding protein
MARNPALARSVLFSGLDDPALDEIAALMRPRSYEAGEQLCRAGDPTDAVWVITAGLVHWLAPTTEGAGDLLLRLRKGDVIGAQDSITGEPRSATVVASIPTTALEMTPQDFAAAAQRHPSILTNLIRTQRERLFRAGARIAEKELGEEIALVVGPSLAGVVGPIVAAAKSASTRPVSYLSRGLSFAGALTTADLEAAHSATVLIPGDLDPVTLGALLDEVDRVVAIVGSGEEVGRLGNLSDVARSHRLEVVLVGAEAQEARHRVWPANSRLAVVREVDRRLGFPLADADIAWIARHLTRTKLGVALGAGGAKGYAHVGALRVLEEAGYVIDYAGGSSIGGFVASHLALGHSADAIDERFRAAFDEETVSSIFQGPFGGGAAGLEALTQMLHEATDDKSFADTVIPLVIMAVDLTDRAAIPIRDGALWEALLSALAVAGVFPTQERDGHRLVDAIALVPVPTASVVEAGADIVVSVNLMSSETLDRWPEGPEIPPPPAKKRRGALDTMLEVMDLSQLDTSSRLAALADVAITPKFAPVDWRDFHLADLFVAAGRSAAEEKLPDLQAISRPVKVDATHRESGLGAVL